MVTHALAVVSTAGFQSLTLTSWRHNRVFGARFQFWPMAYPTGHTGADPSDCSDSYCTSTVSREYITGRSARHSTLEARQRRREPQSRINCRVP